MKKLFKFETITKISKHKKKKLRNKCKILVCREERLHIVEREKSGTECHFMDVVSKCFFLSSWPEEKYVTKRETVKPISRVNNDETQEKYTSWKFINNGYA